MSAGEIITDLASQWWEGREYDYPDFAQDCIAALRAAGYVVAKRDLLTTHIAAAIKADALIAVSPSDVYNHARKTAEAGIQTAEDYA